VGVQSLQYVVSSISCARRPREVVRLRSPIVLFAHGSGRARCERAEHEAWAVAQSLQYVVSSISCARRPRGLVRLRSPMVLSTPVPVPGSGFGTPSPSRARDLALSGTGKQQRGYAHYWQRKRAGIHYWQAAEGLRALFLIVGGFCSGNAMRETRGKGTVYTRHQSEAKAR